MKSLTNLVLAIAVTMPASRMVAQDKPKPPEHFYHLIFQVEELDGGGKLINSRTYTTTAATDDHQSTIITTGTKVPVHNGEKGDVNYLDVGVSIDVREAAEDGEKLVMIVNANVSSVAASPDTQPTIPIIRQNAWHARAVVPVGKPTVIFVSDNLENKGKTQVELTATRMQ